MLRKFIRNMQKYKFFWRKYVLPKMYAFYANIYLKLYSYFLLLNQKNTCQKKFLSHKIIYLHLYRIPE